ncbi:hypothetical protein M405DRAFT_869938 [Rhizopogon salebrosus TDB-379]|nr:hypothetical protein M405DRAFT_869938 [Rhizopogon salebrosus TDB-379]
MGRVDNYGAEYDDANATSLNGPGPRVIGNKRQLPSSPSPPPTRPSFSVPQKPRTNSYNSHAAFTSLGRGGSAKPSSAATSSTSAHTPSTRSLFRQLLTSQTSLPKSKSKASNKKRIHSDIREQVEMMNDEVESISSERVTRSEMKNEHAIAKLNVYRQEKEYQFIREERVHEWEDVATAHQRAQEEAAAAHQRVQEAADRAIKLREAEAKAYALEVETLQLKIRLHELSTGK